MKVRQKLKSQLKTPKGGRPKRLSEQDVRSCIKHVTSGGAETAAEASKRLSEATGRRISASTVRRVLKKSGLQAREKQIKPKLSIKHIRDRLRFAQEHKDWTIDDWKRVVFSDESKINRFNSDGRSWCWIRDGESLQPRQVKQTVKHGGGSVMIWGCMTYNGGGSVIQIKGIMDQHLYRKILADELVPTVDEMEYTADEVIFQHDNDPKHKAKSVQEWLGGQEFSTMWWPAQSPDLNPIEHLWSMIKIGLNKYEAPPRGIIELYSRVEEVYLGIPKEFFNNLYESMPRRMQAVIKARGRWTKY